MKKLYILLLCGICSSAFGSNTTFKKLAEVNPCWYEQPDVQPSTLPAFQGLTERAWIRTHLSLVEGILRKRNTDNLSPSQRSNRFRCLDNLHGYWLAGNFPINEDYARRTPIFIDKHDNFCAVGYLVKASGHENISRMIASKTNLAYVRQMHYPELDTWAVDNGFTSDELAWIQPGYGSDVCYGKKIGNGVDGFVSELFADNASGKLFVGGSFVNTDAAIPANNIAYLTESGGAYTWHHMEYGVNGPVYAIAKFDDKIFVGGSFSMAGSTPVNNIAYWDGTAWHSAGCINGVIFDIAVFAGVLFAAGDFDSCGSGGETNFAKWDGSNWQPIPGVIGRVNTLETTASSIILGGSFTHGTLTKNVVRWDPIYAFQPFYNDLSNEVMDFEMYSDSLYAACKHTDTTGSNELFMVLRSGYWKRTSFYELKTDDFDSSEGSLSLNTLCNTPAAFIIGGQFTYSPPVVPSVYNYSSNNFSISGCISSFDSAVNKMELFNNEIFVGGKFKYGFSESGIVALNGIARRALVSSLVPESTPSAKRIKLHPNPISSGSILTVENNFNANKYTLHDVTGRLQVEGELDKTQQVLLQAVTPGMYIVSITNDTGEKVIQKIVVE